MRALTLTGTAVLLATLITGCREQSAPTAASEEDRQSYPSPSLTNPPVIGVSKATFHFLAYAFRPTYNPPGQALTISNLGGGTLTWTARDNGYWLSLSSTSGTAPSTVMVRVKRSAIPIGVNGYRPRFLQATITLSAQGASNTPITIPVGLSIQY
jgi:hypothetical protein